MITFLKKLFYFYVDGFKSMTLGRTLWMIILLKLFIMFVVLKIFFFKDFLNEKFEKPKDKANYVLEQLTH